MILGLSRVDGVFPSASELQTAVIPNSRKVSVISAGNPITTIDYWTESVDRGGLLLAGGNYANRIINTSGSGDMVKSIYDPSNKNTDAFNRANHEGTQPLDSITGLQAALDSKEDGLGNPAVDGYVLTSTAAGVRRWVAMTGGGGATNLGYTASPTDGTVTSDTGTDATIPAGSETNASLMLPADKTKLNGVGVGAQVVSVQAGTNVTVDNTDPQNPMISATGGGLQNSISGDQYSNVGVAVSVLSGGERAEVIIDHSLGVVPSSVTISGVFRLVSPSEKITGIQPSSITLSTGTSTDRNATLWVSVPGINPYRVYFLQWDAGSSGTITLNA